jgi:hypothetical protein
LRVVVSKVRMPRSHKITLGFVNRRYSAPANLNRRSQSAFQNDRLAGAAQGLAGQFACCALIETPDDGLHQLKSPASTISLMMAAEFSRMEVRNICRASTALENCRDSCLFERAARASPPFVERLAVASNCSVD